MICGQTQWALTWFEAFRQACLPPRDRSDNPRWSFARVGTVVPNSHQLVRHMSLSLSTCNTVNFLDARSDRFGILGPRRSAAYVWYNWHFVQPNSSRLPESQLLVGWAHAPFDAITLPLLVSQLPFYVPPIINWAGSVLLPTVSKHAQERAFKGRAVRPFYILYTLLLCSSFSSSFHSSSYSSIFTTCDFAFSSSDSGYACPC